MPRITPNLWFDTQGHEAAEFYVSVFPNSRITNVLRHGEAGPGPAGTVLTVDFVLDGQEYTAINGGPQFTFDEAISLLINCADQDEVEKSIAAMVKKVQAYVPGYRLKQQVLKIQPIHTRPRTLCRTSHSTANNSAISP